MPWDKKQSGIVYFPGAIHQKMDVLKESILFFVNMTDEIFSENGKYHLQVCGNLGVVEPVGVQFEDGMKQERQLLLDEKLMAVTQNRNQNFNRIVRKLVQVEGFAFAQQFKMAENFFGVNAPFPANLIQGFIGVLIEQNAQFVQHPGQFGIFFYK
jgi:hypothetical protein